MNSDQGTDPGEVVNARVRCTCGAEIDYAEMICRNGHNQAWMRELPKMVACDDGSCEHRDCAEVRSTLRRRADLIGQFHPATGSRPQTPDDPWNTGSAELFSAQVIQQHYALGDPRSATLHPGLMKACDDPECVQVRQCADSVGRFHPMVGSSDNQGQHYARNDPRSSILHPGPIADCTDPETCWWWQRSQLPQSVEGVGPDASTETNEHGASQSKALYAFTSLDPHALFRVAATAAFGDAKYGVDNWRGISALDHLNHALTHIHAHLADDTSDDHLAHAACRMLMALAVDIQGGPRARS